MRKHTRLRSPDEMELMELRLFATAPLTPRGVLSEDMIFFFPSFFQRICLCFGFLDMCGLRGLSLVLIFFARVQRFRGCDENYGPEGYVRTP